MSKYRISPIETPEEGRRTREVAGRVFGRGCGQDLRLLMGVVPVLSRTRNAGDSALRSGRRGAATVAPES